MKPRKIHDTLPDELLNGLRRMGEDIAIARRTRKMSQQDLATRLNVGRMTVVRMEKGDHRVSLGTVAGAAWIMGLEKTLLSAFDPEADPVFKRNARLDMPRRIDTRRGYGDSPDDTPDEEMDF